MRPLYHPSVNAITVEGILHALSNPVRVQIFSEIAHAECPQTCSKFLMVNNKALPKSTLSQHFRILREAGLIHSVRSGVELHNSTRCAELRDSFGPMINAILAAYVSQHSSKKTKRSP